MLGIAILISAAIKELAGVNIALNKNITCDVMLLDKKVTDGDLNIINPVNVMISCSQLYIYLGGSFIVHYVIVYEGTKNTMIGNWDYFSAYLKNSLDEQRSCAMFPRLAVTPKYMVGNRVNCMGWPGSYFSMVELVSPLNHGYTFAEIEVHSIGLGQADGNVMIYRGCYLSSPFRRSGEGHSIETCGRMCRNYGFAYIVEKRCRCTNFYDLKKEIAPNRCYYNCPNNPGKYCGGKVGYSVYIVNVQLPYYNGCYDDIVICTVSNCVEDNLMNPVKCVEFCRRSMFAHIKDGSTCLCTDTIPKAVDIRQNCDIPCPGDPNNMCGGKESQSTYGTCVFGGNIMTCQDLIQCDDQMDEFGNCLGECKDGYTGEYCLEKDLRVILFDYEPTTTTIKPRKTISKLPKAKITPTETETFEETTAPVKIIATATIEPLSTMPKAKEVCKGEPCRIKPNTKCVPSATRNFTCECLKGFFEVGTVAGCEDINECLMSPCDPETSGCKNTRGSYFCDCIPGFALDETDTCINLTMFAAEFDYEQHVMYIFYATSGLLIASLLYIYWYDTSEISD